MLYEVITDLGGPSANMYKMEGFDLAVCVKCRRASCIFPSVCKNLNTDHTPLITIYRKALLVKGIKHAFVGSGIRYDLLLDAGSGKPISPDKSEYIKQLIAKHVSGRLKVAPVITSYSIHYTKLYEKICMPYMLILLNINQLKHAMKWRCGRLIIRNYWLVNCIPFNSSNGSHQCIGILNSIQHHSQGFKRISNFFFRMWKTEILQATKFIFCRIAKSVITSYSIHYTKLYDCKILSTRAPRNE